MYICNTYTYTHTHTHIFICIQVGGCWLVVEVYDKDIYICPHRRGRRRHSADSFSTAQPCGAVGSLAANADNKVLIAKEGGIGRLLAALDKHAEHAGVVDRACGALGNIGNSDEALQKSIKGAGAEQLVRAAVGRSNASSNTRKWGQRLLDKLAQL